MFALRAQVGGRQRLLSSGDTAGHLHFPEETRVRLQGRVTSSLKLEWRAESPRTQVSETVLLSWDGAGSSLGNKASSRQCTVGPAGHGVRVEFPAAGDGNGLNSPGLGGHRPRSDLRTHCSAPPVQAGPRGAAPGGASLLYSRESCVHGSVTVVDFQFNLCTFLIVRFLLYIDA